MTIDTDGAASNGWYTAVPWNQTSTIAVFPAYKFQRFEADLPLIKGHKGSITDI